MNGIKMEKKKGTEGKSNLQTHFSSMIIALRQREQFLEISL